MIGLCHLWCIRLPLSVNFLNDISSWTSELLVTVPHDALFQNCINGSTPLNRRAARAPDKRHLLNHRLKSIFCTFVSSKLWPLIYARISFPLNILRKNWQNSPNFIYALILTRSRLGLLHKIVRIFVLELWPLIYARILFPLNILRTNWHNFTKLSSSLGLFPVIFCLFVTELWTLIYVIVSFPLNILRPNG